MTSVSSYRGPPGHFRGADAVEVASLPFSDPTGSGSDQHCLLPQRDSRGQ